MDANNTVSPTEPKADNAAANDQVPSIVMPEVVGYVTYDVCVECPHCGKPLQLNQYPYNDDRTDYSLAKDDLGLALFGKEDRPAKWDGFDIEYACCGCKQRFRLSRIEI